MRKIQPDQVIELTQKLVRIPSEAGQEREIADFLAAEMEALRFDRVERDELGNVVGSLEGDHPGPTLLLDGHMDTVGVAPGVEWTHPPFGGEIEGGRLYGRGSADMKGPLAAMTLAAAGIDRSRIAGRLVISASVMEEVLEGAALKAVMDREKPDYVIIGEASNLHIVHGGRGRAEIHLETLGVPAHSSSPDQGVNAVEAMMAVLANIHELILPEHPLVGKAILVLTDIISEPYPGHSVIPSRCRATFDRRLMPGESQEQVVEDLLALGTIPGARLSARLGIGEYQAYSGRKIKMRKWFPAWILDPVHPLVRAAAAGLEQSGLPVKHGVYNFCTNATYSMGVAGVPTIGFGPSQEAMAHIVDEYILLEDLVNAWRAYRGMIDSILAP